MAVHFIRLVLTWLLLTASATLTSGQTHGFTEVITGELTVTAQNQVTSSDAPLTVSESDATALTAKGTQTEQTTGIQTTVPEISTVETEAAATSTNSTSSWINTSAGSVVTAGQSTVGESTASGGTAEESNPTEFTTTTPKLSSTTQSLDTGNTSTAVSSRSETPGASTRLLQPTRIASSATTPAEPEEGKSHGTSPTTGGGGGGGGGLTPSSASDQTPAATAVIPITKPKKKTDPPEEKAKSNAGTNHGKVVAGIIGGALLLMMVGFLVIHYKKRNLQRQNTTTSDWAGPSPFLESGSNNGHVAMRSSNRISLSGFLPQRLSKRLSLLPETDEEMEDMTPATTFGTKPLENSNGQKVDENGVKEMNGSVAPDVKSTGDSTEADKTSPQTNDSEVSSAIKTQKPQAAGLSVPPPPKPIFLQTQHFVAPSC
uniref:Uncharacterized protein n=1 Tax=Salarias fasciatus TaxID=181472 RepID=A0A672HCF0_SALFA